jgi:hypothetical protein
MTNPAKVELLESSSRAGNLAKCNGRSMGMVLSLYMMLWLMFTTKLSNADSAAKPPFPENRDNQWDQKCIPTP